MVFDRRNQELLLEIQKRGGLQFALQTIDRKVDFDDDELVVKRVSIVSDQPIDHWFGKVRLSMDKKAVRRERLMSNRMAGLENHDWNQQRFVVENATIDRDGKVRGDFRFSDSVAGRELYSDVKRGIKTNVSGGLLLYAIEVEKEEKGKPTIYRSDDWELIEASIVSIPADTGVGVGRGLNSRTEKKMSIESEVLQTSPEMAAASEIREWGNVLGEQAAATQYIRSSTLADGRFTGTKEGLFALLRDARRSTSTPMPVMDPWTAAERNGAPPRFELARSIPRYGKLQAFTGEGAEERAFRFGQWVLGGPLGNGAARNWCQQNGLMITRAGQFEGVNEKGGYTVPEEFGNDFVELLEKHGIFRQHAHIVPMSSDRRTDLVLNGELESEFVGEMEEGEDSDLDFGQIAYTAQKHMVLVPMSSEVVEDSAISIGDQVANAAGKAFAKKEDLCGFNGDATSAYGGITGIREALKAVDGTIGNIQGLQVGTGNTYAELALTDFEGVVGRLPDYADVGNAKWFVSRKFYHNVMMKILLNASGVTATEIEDGRNRKFLGYPVVYVPVMPATEANSQVCAIFGDLSQGARLADRRRFTTAIDESILFKKDALLFRATARFDINVSYGVGDTVAAGPIVGLITAAA